jgi:general nucleoside transport system permease protein
MGVFDAFWVATTLTLATPLVFAASGELVSERTGVMNIGLEGMMLAGAFFGFSGAYLSGNGAVAIAAGAVAGMAIAAIMAVLAIHARADQIVVGLGLNILVLGITAFLFRRIFAGNQIQLDATANVAVPGLSRLPVLGEALFRQPLLVYLAPVVLAAVWVLLHRSAWGLAMRAAGEEPEAADAAGADPMRARWAGTLTAGALAGVGGAFLSSSTGVFIEGMTAGRGYLALAAVIFGRWRPLGVLVACLVFGAADALQLRLQSQPVVPREVWLAPAVLGLIFLAGRLARFRFKVTAVSLRPVAALVALAAVVAGLAAFAMAPRLVLPSQLWRALPYAVTLAVLASVAGRGRIPAALATPYRRGGSA